MTRHHVQHVCGYSNLEYMYEYVSYESDKKVVRYVLMGLSSFRNIYV